MTTSTREGRYQRLIQAWVTEEMDDAINEVVDEQEVPVPKTAVIRQLLHDQLRVLGKLKKSKGRTKR